MLTEDQAPQLLTVHTFLLSALTSIHLELSLYFRHLHHAQLPEQEHQHCQVQYLMVHSLQAFAYCACLSSDGDLNGQDVTDFVIFDSPDNVNDPSPIVWQ